MICTASAPGKLVLAGEYAVLEGAPALVMAIDRRARVVLRDFDCGYSFDAPDLGVTAARCRLDAAGRVQWSDAADGARLGLVSAALEAIAAAGIPAPFRAELDTHGFFIATADYANTAFDAGRTCMPNRPSSCSRASTTDRVKLGLGSSAALLVALAGAICVREGRSAPTAAALIDAHRRLQQGRGSGLDIAASLMGGLVRYRRCEGGLRDAAPQVVPVPWPHRVAFCCVWSGRPASTPRMLQQMAAWRECQPKRYAGAIAALGACATAAAATAEAGDAPGLLQALGATAEQLVRLGEASGVDIVSAEHRRIAAIAAQCGVVYKSCGAGGGDVGIALTLEAERLQALRAHLAAGGFQVLDMVLEAHGLLMEG